MLRARPRTAADRCPGALDLHQARDGWLARVRLPGGRLGCQQLKAVAHGCSLGNGLVEITSRANLQLRGLPENARSELGAILCRAGLVPSVAHDRARNIMASPVAGRHPQARAGTDRVVSELDRRLCADRALAQLSGRFLFAVDDGSGLALDRVADVALVARDEETYELVVAGRTQRRPVRAADAPGAAVRVAQSFLEERDELGVRAWRIAELGRGGSETPSRPRGRRLGPGRVRQRNGRVAVTALVPLGQLDALGLLRLAAIAPEVRLGAGRTVTVTDVDEPQVAQVERELSDLGLVLDPASGWIGLSACAGLGRCTRARVDVRAAAAARAHARAPNATPEHWVACERRCGQPGGDATVVVLGAG